MKIKYILTLTILTSLTIPIFGMAEYYKKSREEAEKGLYFEKKPLVFDIELVAFNNITKFRVLFKAIITALTQFYDRSEIISKISQNIGSIVTEGLRIKREGKVSGILNIIHDLNENYFKTKLDFDLTDADIQALASIFIEPALNVSGLEFIRSLRNKGYQIIGITNRDNESFTLFNKELQQEKQVNLINEFDQIITGPFYHIKFPPTATYRKITIDNKPVYVSKFLMPNRSFYNIIKTIIGNKKALVISKNKEYAEGAEKADDIQFKGILFTSFENLASEIERESRLVKKPITPTKPTTPTIEFEELD